MSFKLVGERGKTCTTAKGGKSQLPMEWRNRRKLSLSEEEEEVLFGMFGKSDLCEAGSFSLPKNRRTYPREFFEPFT